MAINSNNAHEARHTLYCGTTGAGKTVAVKLREKLGLEGWKGKNVAIFDVYSDYVPSRFRSLSGLGGRKVYHYNTRRTFAKAFIDAWKTGKPFAVAYIPNIPDNADPLEKAKLYRAEAVWFASLMWAACDGNRELHVIFEEMAKYMLGTGKDNSVIGELATGGRKFGVICHFCFQRPVEVPKTIVTQCPYMVIGAQQTKHDAKYWVEEMDCTLDEIIELGRLNQKRKKYYLLKSPGIGNYCQKSAQF